MIRGTTTQFKFKLPYLKEELAWATIKFWQPNNPNPLLPIIRKLTDCENSKNLDGVCVSLTAEETSRFIDKYKAKVQMRACHASSGTVFGVKPQLIPVYPMSDDILEEDPMLPGENADGFVVLDGKQIDDNRDTLNTLDAQSIVE